LLIYATDKRSFVAGIFQFWIEHSALSRNSFILLLVNIHPVASTMNDRLLPLLVTFGYATAQRVNLVCVWEEICRDATVASYWIQM
jgi:hypothetical protein